MRKTTKNEKCFQPHSSMKLLKLAFSAVFYNLEAVLSQRNNHYLNTKSIYTLLTSLKVEMYCEAER